MNDSNPTSLEKFNDKRVFDTEWTLLVDGAPNYKTHQLKCINKNLYQFKASKKAWFFPIIFAMVGILILLIAVAELIGSEYTGEDLFLAGFLFFFSIACGITSMAIYKFMMIPTQIDFSLNMAWKGRSQPDLTGDQKGVAYLNKTIALQLLSQVNRSQNNKSRYMTYELNLVQKDGERFNLIHHGNLNQIRKDADDLSEKLNISIWDRTSS